MVSYVSHVAEKSSYESKGFSINYCVWKNIIYSVIDSVWFMITCIHFYIIRTGTQIKMDILYWNLISINHSFCDTWPFSYI